MKTQDKAIRRIAELKEEKQLEHKAKQELEANYRKKFDEKESVILELQTQVQIV